MATIKSSIEEEPADSFTSMIDIVFLLLIFFILQPFKMPEKKLNSELPQKDGPSTNVSIVQNIQVEIRTNPTVKDGAYYKVQSVVIPDPSTLHLAILNQARNDHTIPIVIDSDQDVQFHYVLTALDHCYKAEMKKVSFSAPPQNLKKNDYMEIRRDRDTKIK